MTAELERFLRRRFPDLDLRVTRDGAKLIVRYATPAARGRKFPILFQLEQRDGEWFADRDYDRGIIGETVEFLRWCL